MQGQASHKKILFADAGFSLSEYAWVSSQEDNTHRHGLLMLRICRDKLHKQTIHRHRVLILSICRDKLITRI
jgi:hypothetical protein